MTIFIVRKQKPAWLAKFAALGNVTPPVTVKTTSGQIVGYQPEEMIDGYGGTDFEKR